MTAEDLMRQATTTAQFYMLRAVTDIDELFGKGFAGRNPALVGAYMQAAATDFTACYLVQSVDKLAERLDEINSTLGVQ